MKTSIAMLLTGFTIALFSQCSEKKGEVSAITDENVPTQSTMDLKVR